MCAHFFAQRLKVSAQQHRVLTMCDVVFTCLYGSFHSKELA